MVHDSAVNSCSFRTLSQKVIKTVDTNSICVYLNENCDQLHYQGAKYGPCEAISKYLSGFLRPKIFCTNN
jgi:hypothetical protein